MRAFMLACALLAACGAAAHCLEPGEQPYSASVVGFKIGGAASDDWDYRVVNTSPSDNYVLWLVGVEVDESCNVLNAISPTGWVADFTSQPHFVVWTSIAADIPAGDWLDGFQITYSAPPACQMYSAMFVNIDDPNDIAVDFGDVVTTIPEPASLTAMIIGLSSLAAVALKRRR